MTEESVIVEAWREAMGRADYPDMDLRDLAALFLAALQAAGWSVIRSDSWRLRSDFDVVPRNDGPSGAGTMEP